MRRITPTDLPGPPLAQEVLARFCQEARKAEQVRQIVVYGSMARGEAGPESDLDIWIDWDGDERDGRRILQDLAAQFFVDTGLFVSVHVIDARHKAKLEAMDSMFYRNVQREGLVVEG